MTDKSGMIHKNLIWGINIMSSNTFGKTKKKDNKTNQH